MHFTWVNLSGAVLVLLLLVPNLLYAWKGQKAEKRRLNPIFHILEQGGRYGCMLLTVFPRGLSKAGFSSVPHMLLWFLGIGACMLAYWGFWAAYFHRKTPVRTMVLAILPCVMFALHGIILKSGALMLCTTIFAVGHIAISWENRQEMKKSTAAKSGQ